MVHADEIRNMHNIDPITGDSIQRVEMRQGVEKKSYLGEPENALNIR